jgi:hypothetical protein
MILTKTARGQPMKNGTIKMMYLARVRNLMRRELTKSYKLQRLHQTK